MRAITIAAAMALAGALTSVANAQGDVSPPNSTKAPASDKSDNNFWPSPAQESAIPYRPCNTDVEFQNGRHACLNTDRY